MTQELQAFRRRGADRGWLCWVALRLADLWDWFDKRDIDKHLMAWATFSATCYVGYWGTEFVWAHPDKPGLEVAAIVGALLLPWTPMQAKVIQWYFEARTE